MNARPKTIKVVEENIDSKLLDIGLGDDFLDLTPKAKATKANKTKQKQTKTKGIISNFLPAKETINEMERQATNREKIFSNHISDKGLILKKYEEHIQLNSTPPQNPNNPIRK